MKSATIDTTRDKLSKASSLFGWWSRSRTFLAQVRNEVDRVTWPSWKEVQATTLVVILTSMLFGVYLWGLDLVLDAFYRLFLRAFGAS